jgi:hypothetical protein
MSENRAVRLFCYGSLLSPDVQQQVFGDDRNGSVMPARGGKRTLDLAWCFDGFVTRPTDPSFRSIAASYNDE